MGLHRRPSSPPKSKYASAWQPGACEFPQWESTWETAGSLVGIHRDSLNSSRQSQRHAASSRSCESLHRQGPTGGYRYYGSLEEDRYYGSLEEDSSQGELIWAWPHVEGVGTGDVCNAVPRGSIVGTLEHQPTAGMGLNRCVAVLLLCAAHSRHTYAHAHAYTYTYFVCVGVCAGVYVRVYTFVYAHMYMYMYACAHVYVCMRICTCMHICSLYM